MKEKRIYELAYREMMRIWYEAENEHKIVNNEASHRRVHKAWDELKELQQIIDEKFQNKQK